MRVTAILNMKGGVGKTTTAVNMAAILARDHKARVLLIDADSQCNTTEFFGADPKGGNLADILRQKGPSDLTYAQTCIWKTQYPGVDVMPGDDSLMDLDLSKVEAGSVNANVLRLLTRAVAGRYDYILIDCPPAFNAASAAAHRMPLPLHLMFARLLPKVFSILPQTASHGQTVENFMSAPPDSCQICFLHFRLHFSPPVPRFFSGFCMISFIENFLPRFAMPIIQQSDQ